MLLVSYATDSYSRWISPFIESFRIFHGIATEIVINSSFVTKAVITGFTTKHSNVRIVNNDLDLSGISNQTGISLEELVIYKGNIAEGIRRGNNRIWQNIVSARERNKRLLETLESYPGEEVFVSMDIDMLFRGSIIPVIDQFLDEGYEIGICGLPEATELDGYCCNAFIIWRNTTKVLDFLREWVSRLYTPSLLDIPQGVAWGMRAFYHVYRDNYNEIKWYDLPRIYQDSRWESEGIVWCANRKLDGSRTNTYRFFLEEFNKLKELKR